MGHFTCDQGQDDFSIEAAANPNLIDSTTDSTTNINFQLDTTKKQKKERPHEARLQEKGQL